MITPRWPFVGLQAVEARAELSCDTADANQQGSSPSPSSVVVPLTI